MHGDDRGPDYALAEVRGCLVGVGLAALVMAASASAVLVLLVVAERVWGIRLRW